MSKVRERLQQLIFMRDNFSVAGKDNGRPSKWIPIKEITSPPDTFFFRQQLENEIILELDKSTLEENKQLYERIKPKLVTKGIAFEAWTTQSKSYHIHIFFDKTLADQERQAFIETMFEPEEIAGMDSNYWTKNSRQLVAIGGAVHYKSGKPKILLEALGEGVNKFPNISIPEHKKENGPKEAKIKKSLKDILKSENPTEQERCACVMKIHNIHPEWNAEQINDYLSTECSWQDYNSEVSRKKVEGIIKAYFANDSDAEEFFEKGQFIPKRLGDRILDDANIKTLTGSNEIYYYKDGVYMKGGREKIKELCVDLLQEKYSKHRFSETVSYIEGSTYIDPDEINNNWINLKNGLLDPITKEFKEHTPEVFSTIRIPIEYDSNADCPLFKEKLTEKTDAPTLSVVQEMFGYCYLPGQRFEVAFLFYGPKRTMKSTTLHVLGKMLGSENVTAHSLQYLSDNPFGISYLYGIPANVCADLDAKALRNTGAFMLLTGGDKISAAKKHEHPVNFYPSTKLIFSCNNIPPTTNKDLAFYRRWVILKFEKQTPKEDVDSTLKEKLEKELPGILNWALEGLDRLLEQDRFSYWLNEEEVKDLYEKGADSIQSFIFNCIDIEDDEGVLKKRDVYKRYKEYCKEEDLKVENQIKFGRMFKELTGCGTCQQNKIPAYQGVSYKEGPKQGTLEEFQ